MRLLPLILLASACTNPDLNALEEAETRWDDLGLTDYEYDVQYSCFCPQSEAHVIVTGGQADATQTGEPGGEVPADLLTGVEGLFERVRTTIEGDPAELDVSYDPTYGFPSSVQVDPIANAVDDEWGFTVSGFISGPIPPG